MVLYPSLALIGLAHKYKDVSEDDFRNVVAPLYAEAVYHRHGYVHARRFKANAVAAHRAYRKVSARSNSQRLSAPEVVVPISSARPLNSGRARRSRSHARARPAAPDDPAPYGLRKLTNLHSCADCECDGSHPLVRIEGMR